MPCFQVVNILETRAHSIELSKNRYYDLLYAFHVKRNNYRKGETRFRMYSVVEGFEWRGGTARWASDSHLGEA